VMNYLFTAPTLAFVAGDRVIRELAEPHEYDPYPALDAAGYARRIQDLIALYPWEIQLTQLNLLGSHDTPRVLTLVSDDLDSMKLAVLLKMTFPGAPCVYYGDEVGLAGGNDPDCRRSFPQPEVWNHEILETYYQSIALRHRYSALRTGHYEVLLARDLVYVFSRKLDEREVIVAINAGTETEIVTLETITPNARSIQLQYGSDRITKTLRVEGQMLTFELPPRSGCVFG